MAQLLLIKTANTPAKFYDDVVGSAAFEDAHNFSEYELQIFNVLYINGSREDVQNRIDQIKIRIESAWYWEADQIWSFSIPTAAEVETGEVTDYTEVWFDSPNRWRRVVNDFKFPVSVQDITPEEREILATVDINHPSVDSFIMKIIKDLSADPANMEEIRDLRNLEP